MLAAAAGCVAPKSTSLKTLKPVRLRNSISITVACIRDVSEETIATGLFDPEKRTIDLSEAAELKIGNLLQDSGSLSRVMIVPHREIPDDATELTCISLARKENTNLVIHGEVNHRASFSLNWLTWPSYLPGIVVMAPLWSPNYTLKGEVELTLHVVDAQSLERIFSRKITEEAYSCVSFLTRALALHDRFTDLEKNTALHNTAVEAGKLLLETLASYRPGKAGPMLAPLNKVIAVVDFQPGSAFVERMGYGTTAAEMFTTAFEKSGAFKVIERQRIRDILTERAFSMTDLVQPEKAGQVAKLLGIDFLLVGSVAQLGGRLELNVRFLDISTGKVLFSESDGIKRVGDLQILAELMTRRVIERFTKTKPASEK